jgi:hypothetical protein
VGANRNLKPGQTAPALTVDGELSLITVKGLTQVHGSAHSVKCASSSNWWRRMRHSERFPHPDGVCRPSSRRNASLDLQQIRLPTG